MSMLTENPQYVVYANLVKNGYMPLSEVPKEIRPMVESIVISDIPFDINGEKAIAESSPIVEYKTIAEFPNIGIGNRLYIARESNKAYRWDSETMTYECIKTEISLSDLDIGDIDFNLGVIDCGDSRK